ncbi:MAG: hypothetical protein FJ125_14180, partial [Deltaproteobacteria bacterium]|nr:hypothetical protein [Deltaproteobacteria bacterium]
MEELQYLSHLLADTFKHPSRRKDQGKGGFAPLGDSQADEQAAIAVGALLLLLFEERGGTALSRNALLRLAEDA